MGSAGSDDRSFSRSARGAWAVLALALLLFAGSYSYLAPVGTWKNRIFDQGTWFEHDPAGAYVDAAHQLSWGESPLFAGHPGTTLLVLLKLVQYAYYTAAAEPGYSFTQFTARNLPTVFLLSKLMMTVLHLLSFFLVFAVARALLRSERAAFFASLGYATSLPVLYYLSRISVEPLMVSLFLLSFLASWKWQDLAAAQRARPALGVAGLAGALAVSGAVTKLNFLGPLPFFLALYLLLGSRREDGPDAIRFSERVRAFAVFCMSGTVLAVLYSQVIGWQTFFALWRIVAAMGPDSGWSMWVLLPGATPEGALVLCELAFVAMAAAGWVALMLRDSERRSRALWLSAFGAWGLLLFAYRVQLKGTLLPFHYFFLANVVAAVFFGHFTELLWRRISVRSEGWRGVVFGLAWVALVHGIAVWVVVDSRQFDARTYSPNRAAHVAIAQLRPDQRLGCIGCRRLKALDFHLHKLHAIGRHSLPILQRDGISRLENEFSSFFIPVHPRQVAGTLPRVYVPALKKKIVIVDQPDLQPGRE